MLYVETLSELGSLRLVDRVQERLRRLQVPRRSTVRPLVLPSERRRCCRLLSICLAPRRHSGGVKVDRGTGGLVLQRPGSFWSESLVWGVQRASLLLHLLGV